MNSSINQNLSVSKNVDTPSSKGYVQQLALSSLRKWLLNEMEGGEREGRFCKIESKNVNKLCQQKGNPIAVMSIWETLIEAQNNRDFVKFCEGNGYSIEDIKGTITGWSKFECGRKIDFQKDIKGNTQEESKIKGREIWLPSVDMMFYNGNKGNSLGKYNPYKSFHDCKSSVSRTMRRIESLDLETVYDVVLTLPQEVSTMCFNEPTEITEKTKKITKKFFKWLSDVVVNGKIAVNINTHPWGSENPLSSHLHEHNLLLGMYLDNEGKKKYILPTWFMKKNERTKRYEEGNLTKLLKSKWAFFVNREFNTSYESLDVRIEFIELKRLCKDGKLHESLEGERKLLHKLKYNRRRPISDLALFFTENKFNPKDNNIIWNEFLMEYKNKPITLGYWNRMSKHAVKTLTTDVKTRCPFCHKVMQYVGFEPNRELPKNVDRVFIDRSNKFYYQKGIG